MVGERQCTVKTEPEVGLEAGPKADQVGMREKKCLGLSSSLFGAETLLFLPLSA